MNSKDTPVKIGIEVESRYPDDYDCFVSERRNEALTIHPLGWRNGRDAHMEFRFDGPADTMQEAFRRLDVLKAFFHKYRFNNFEDQGTHIHFGARDFLKENYPDSFLKTRWRSSITAKFLCAYLAVRTAPIWGLIPDWRESSGWCEPIELCLINEIDGCESGSSLLRLHNYLAAKGDNVQGLLSGCVEFHRRDLPTFEVRMFPGTKNLDAIKGYLALFISMIKRAKMKMDQIDWKEVAPLPSDTPDAKIPTSSLLPHYDNFDLKDLRKEIEETDFLVEPLLDWISRTRKSDSRLVPFHSDLSEIYGASVAQPLAAAA